MTKSTYFSLLIVLAIAAFYLQSQMLLCGDVAYLLHVSNSLLSGGTYARDFFETNPPMILMLYAPVVLLSKVTSINVIVLIRLYVLCLAIVSSSILLFLSEKIFAREEDKTMRFTLGLVIAFIFLFLPAGEFGQREHIFMLLFLPYVFLAMLVTKQKRLSKLLALIIGVMAGFGIGMKPFFLVPLVLIESYLLIKTRSFLNLFRIELVACGLVLLVYLVGVYFYAPTYVYIILPLVSHLYFISSKETWQVIFSYASVIFCLLTLIYYFVISFLRQEKTYCTVDHILLLALIGMIAAFLIPQSAWYYHLIPALGFALLLIARLLFTVKYPIRLVGFLLALMPVYISLHYSENLVQAAKSSDRAEVIAYLQLHPEWHSVYCFSASFTQDCFPLINMTEKNYGGRSPFFWWITGLVALEKQPLSKVVQQDKAYLISAIADDLNQHQTSLVIINVADMKNKLGPHFSYIDYFSTNKKFKQTWQDYHYVTQIGDYELFQRV